MSARPLRNRGDKSPGIIPMWDAMANVVLCFSYTMSTGELACHARVMRLKLLLNISDHLLYQDRHSSDLIIFTSFVLSGGRGKVAE